jgi:hypothetical protein
MERNCIMKSFIACTKYNYNDQVEQDEVVKPERKRSLGRPRHRWVDNFKMDLREI